MRALARFTEVVGFTDTPAVRAVAAWRGRMNFGRDDGSVLRCELQPWH